MWFSGDQVREQDPVTEPHLGNELSSQKSCGSSLFGSDSPADQVLHQATGQATCSQPRAKKRGSKARRGKRGSLAAVERTRSSPQPFPSAARPSRAACGPDIAKGCGHPRKGHLASKGRWSGTALPPPMHRTNTHPKPRPCETFYASLAGVPKGSDAGDRPKKVHRPKPDPPTSLSRLLDDLKNTPMLKNFGILQGRKMSFHWFLPSHKCFGCSGRMLCHPCGKTHLVT